MVVFRYHDYRVDETEIGDASLEFFESRLSLGLSHVFLRYDYLIDRKRAIELFELDLFQFIVRGAFGGQWSIIVLFVLPFGY